MSDSNPVSISLTLTIITEDPAKSSSTLIAQAVGTGDEEMSGSLLDDDLVWHWVRRLFGLVIEDGT